jgi:CDP-4-dehydro-6-deoxyglucose reductase
MTYRIRIEPSRHEFLAEPGETVLEAALRQGRALPYSCRNGSCGSCKGRVLAGEVDYGSYDPAALTEEERRAGKALFCQAVPKSDLVVQAREIAAVEHIAVKTLPARVVKMERAAPEVMILTLKLPQTERLQYLAGQYLDILLAGGERRSFSIANPPGRDEFLELHVRLVPGGRFTGHVFEKMKEKDLLRFRGPLGTFFLRAPAPGAPGDAAPPAILVAGGTGFAPMQAMIEQALAARDPRPLHLYWGARAREDLYRDALAARWAREHAAFRYTPVLSEPRPEDDWHGRTGWVHEAVLADHPDLSGCEVYASGPPAMIEAVRKRFATRGLSEERLFYDSFEYSHAK